MRQQWRILWLLKECSDSDECCGYDDTYHFEKCCDSCERRFIWYHKKNSETRKKQTKQREKEQERTIARLEEELDETENSHLKGERAHSLRGKSKWYNEGEKNTNSLEKRYYRQSTINQLKINEDAFAISDEDILTESASLYKNLYQCKGKTDTLLDTSVFFDGENDTSDPLRVIKTKPATDYSHQKSV